MSLRTRKKGAEGARDEGPGERDSDLKWHRNRRRELREKVGREDHGERRGREREVKERAVNNRIIVMLITVLRVSWQRRVGWRQ